MEIPQQPLQPGMAERAARASVVAFVFLSLVTLAFGLGYVAKDLSTNDTPAGAQGAAGTTATGAAAIGASDPIGGKILDEIYQILKAQYVDRDTLNPSALREAAISGVIASLNDRETHYYGPEALKAVQFSLQSSYEGIGASVSDRSGAVQIVAPFRDSPAEKAGIKPGDTILEVDGQRTDGWKADFAVQNIRGPRGSKVTLKVKHADGSLQTIEIVRGEIPIDSVFIEPNLELIPGESGKKLVDRTGAEATDIGYLNISEFHDSTLAELRTKARDMESRGYRGLILDLRANPGGLLSTTIDVADEFLNSGAILIQVDAAGKRETWTAKQGGILTRIPLVVLIDNGSASASEILAAALRDNGRAKLIGTTTFGKGTVNQLQTLKNCGDPKGCGGLYLSVGRWLTPKGDQIEGVGVKPDIEVPITADQYIAEGDIQVFKAIDVLRGK